MIKEDPNLILKRKYRNILGVCGKGTILFTAWNMVKGLMYIFLGNNMVRQINDAVEAGSVSLPFLIVGAVILILLDLLLCLSVAKMALDEAKGKNTGIFPLIIAGLLILFSLYGVFSMFGDPDISRYYTLADQLVTAFVELTFIFNLTEILVYSIRLRRLPVSAGDSLPGKEED